MNILFGKKIEQTQRFLDDGTRIPVTLVVADSNVIMGFKTPEKDQYAGIKLGFGKRKKITKALFGEMKKLNLDYVPEVIGEVQRADGDNSEPGSMLKVEEVFSPGDIVDVTGISKGKGFASGIKRYNFRGGPKTHGQSDRHRAPGSIGSGTTPGRVYKGKRMAGNMGKDTVTVKNLLVIDVNAQDKTLLIKGLVPGILNGIVKVTKVGEVKEKNFLPLFKAEEITPASVAEVTEDVAVTSLAEGVEGTVKDVPAEEESKDEAIEQVKEDAQEETVATDKSKKEAKEEQNG